MKIGQLAKSVGVNVETIRFYQRIQLLEVPKKGYGSTRSYSDADLQKLRFIRRAQRLGFSLEDIRKLLRLSSADCQQVEELAAEQLKIVQTKLRQLHSIESMLVQTVERCTGRKENQSCPIIETLTA